MSQKTKTVVLEKSTNTHTMTNVIKLENITESILKLETTGDSKVFHGEHHTIAINSKHTLKYVQQEYNPVTNMLQNAWD